jgi:hypothetical protein
MNDDGRNDDQFLDRGLAAELAALRGALRDVRASDADEPKLLAALESRRAILRRASTPAEPAPPAPIRTRRAARAWRAGFAVAAAAALAAVSAVLTLGVERRGDVAGSASSASAPDAAPAPNAPAEHEGAFQPLAFSPGLSPSQSYSVVRVRIPLTALTPGYAAPADATIEADLLVGEDGLASAIRFDKEDTLFVSTVSTQMGERR